jgi:hypothetical protein
MLPDDTPGLDRRTISAVRTEASATRDFDEYSIVSEGRDSVQIRSGSRLPGRRLSFTFRRSQASSVSYFCLFVAGNVLLKVRGSAPAAHAKDTDLPIIAKTLVMDSAKDYHP